MTVTPMIAYADRIDRLLQKTRGTELLSEWEYKCLNDWRAKTWLTHRQVALIGRWEDRVYGAERGA